MGGGEEEQRFCSQVITFQLICTGLKGPKIFDCLSLWTSYLTYVYIKEKGKIH